MGLCAGEGFGPRSIELEDWRLSLSHTHLFWGVVVENIMWKNDSQSLRYLMVKWRHLTGFRSHIL